MSSNPEEFKKILKENLGIDVDSVPDEKLNITLTEVRKLEVSAAPGPSLTLDSVMPVSPASLGNHHIQYFISGNLVQGIRSFIQSLKLKKGDVESTLYKGSMECPDTVMNPKEIAQQIERLAPTNPTLANYMLELHSWITYFEELKMRYIWVCQFLDTVKMYYEQLVDFYMNEYDEHQELFQFEKEKKEEERVLAEKAIVSDKSKFTDFNSAFNHFIQAHEQDAKRDYRDMRRLLDDANDHITQLTELVQKMEAMPRYAKLKKFAREARPTGIMWPFMYPTRRKPKPTVPR